MNLEYIPCIGYCLQLSHHLQHIMLKFPGNDGLVYDYQTEQMLNILWTIGIIQLIILGIMIVMLIFRAVIEKKPPKVDSSTVSERPLIERQSLTQNKPNYDVFLVVASMLFYALLLSCAVSVGVLHGFEKLGRTRGNKILYAAITVVAGIVLHILWKYFTAGSNKVFVEKVKSVRGGKLGWYVLALLLWVTVVGLVFYFMNGVCYCIYNDSFSGNQITTSFTRRLSMDGKVCPGKSICQIYATLPQTTNSSVFINLHTGIDVENITSKMFTNDSSFAPDSQYVFTPQIDEEYAYRKVWTLLFNNLKPSTLYNLTVDTGGDSLQTTYKTLPGFGDASSNIKVLMGGDVGLTPQGREMFDLMAKQSADLLIIGGDVTYDNAMTYCYYPWDMFYGMVGKVSKLGTNNSRLVPLILALGNHDVGFNGLAKQYVFPNVDGPWWYAYNPQHFADDNKSIPEIQDRKSYGYHIIGSTVMVTLDSGYHVTYENQGQYLQNISSYFSSQNFVMMANYHVPLYPSCFHQLPTHGQSQQALKLSLQYYQPVFIKYKYKLCLENHVHKFKRTIPINGVVYIGDGNLGVDAVQCPKEDRISDKYLAKSLYVDSNHYWLGVIYTNRIELAAKNRHNATVIDSTSFPFM